MACAVFHMHGRRWYLANAGLRLADRHRMSKPQPQGSHVHFTSASIGPACALGTGYLRECDGCLPNPRVQIIQQSFQRLQCRLRGSLAFELKVTECSFTAAKYTCVRKSHAGQVARFTTGESCQGRYKWSRRNQRAVPLGAVPWSGKAQVFRGSQNLSWHELQLVLDSACRRLGIIRSSTAVSTNTTVLLPAVLQGFSCGKGRRGWPLRAA